jgi:hypothetical protein
MPVSEFDGYIRRYLNDMGALWSSDTIYHYAAQAEKSLNLDNLLIKERFAPAVTAGNPMVSLPSNYVKISRLRWKGYTVTQLHQQEYREKFPDYVIGASGYTVGGVSSRPCFAYVESQNSEFLQLIPNPPETIAAATTNLWGTAIPNQFIIECYTIPDLTQDTNRIYVKLVRHLIRDYVCYRCFSGVGEGQQLDLAAFYKNNYNTKVSLLQKFNSLLFSSVTKKTSGSENSRASYLRRLPGNYGEVVDV